MIGVGLGEIGWERFVMAGLGVRVKLTRERRCQGTVG